MKKKRLTKSTDKVFLGVFGGIAEYFNWDKAVTRIIGAFLIIFPGTVFAGTLLYLIAALVMPSPSDPNIIEGEFREKDQ